MKEIISAKIDNGKVIEVIVGEASWASENLGGEWVQVDFDYDHSETMPGVGDTYDGNSFTHPIIVIEPLEQSE